MSMKVNTLSSGVPVRPPFLPGTSSALSSRLQSFEKPSSSSPEVLSPRRSSSMGSVDSGSKPKEGMVSQMASRFQSSSSSSSTSSSSSSSSGAKVSGLPGSSGSSSSNSSTGGDHLSKPRILKKPEQLLKAPPKDQLSSSSSVISGSTAKVERSQSHQTRFNHARAMFEKMGGSSEELDGPGAGSKVLRSRSVSPLDDEEEPAPTPNVNGRKASLPAAQQPPPSHLKSSTTSSSIKELTNKQRNWFSHFEKGRGHENEAENSATTKKPLEATSAKSVPQGEDEESWNEKRPLSARTSSSSDSIEDYIRNWKKTSPSSSPPPEERFKNSNQEGNEDSPQVVALNAAAVTKILEQTVPQEPCQPTHQPANITSNAKPALSPKPPPDIVKRLSFNGKKPLPGVIQRRGSHSSSSDDHEDQSGTLVTAMAVTVREEDSEDASSPQLSERMHREFNFSSSRQNGTEFAKNFAQGMIYDASLDDLKSDKILVDDGPLLLDESKSFPSHEPIESKKVNEEFSKLADDQSVGSSSDDPVTAEDEDDPITVVHKSPSVSSVSSSVNEVPFMDDEESHISPLSDKEPSPPKVTKSTTHSEPTHHTNGYHHKGNGESKKEESSSSDEYQDELQFDATVSSGHLSYKEDNGNFRSTPIKLGLDEPKSNPVAIEEMTPNEADMLLSSNLVEKRLTDDQAREVVRLLSPEEEDAKPQAESEDLIVAKAASDALDKLDHLVYQLELREEVVTEMLPVEAAEEPEESIVLIKDPAKEVYFDECTGVHYLDDGHYWFEVDGIDPASALEGSDFYYKSPGRLSFSKEPIRQFSTYSVDEYDRRNDEIDPVAASAEYELEKRVEKMDTFDVELMKGPDGLGLSIIGMGVGADTGLEKLGVFVKTVTAGGPATGKIKVNDLIIEVDGNSLVGVTQAYASSVLQNTSGTIRFVIGRDKDPENSEVAQLIRQSLQADLDRAERQRQSMAQLEPYDSSEHTSVTNSSTVEGEHTIHEEEDGKAYAETSPEDSISSPDNNNFNPAAMTDFSSDPKGQKLRADIQILKNKLEEAQYRNMAIEAEMEEMRSKFTKNSTSTGNSFEEQQIQTERTNLTESGIQTSLSLEDQERSQELERKYAHAKRIIHELKEHEQYLALQLKERDQGYHSHLKLLIDRVIQLEKELASTQKYAGIPISLPYNHDEHSLLSPPELLKRKPVLPDDNASMDISESEEINSNSALGNSTNTMNNKDIKEEFDSAIPAHELLDIRANKFKAELATKGAMMSQRNRPTPDALRSNVLKRSISTASASSFHTTDSFELDQESCSESREATPDSDSGYMAANCVAVSNKAYNKPLPPLPKAPTSPNKNPNFLAEMNNAVQRRQEQQQIKNHSAKPKPSSVASPSSPPPPAISLADQLKSSLEERRKATSGGAAMPDSGVPDELVADIKHAVKIANDNEFRNHPSSSNYQNVVVGKSSAPNSPPKEKTTPSSTSSSSEPISSKTANKNNSANQPWSANPVEEWAKEQVCQWLLALGMESYITLFMDKTITGAALLNFDSNGLKELGIKSKEDREKIKKKIKELKAINDKDNHKKEGTGAKKENFLKKAFHKK